MFLISHSIFLFCLHNSAFFLNQSLSCSVLHSFLKTRKRIMLFRSADINYTFNHSFRAIEENDRFLEIKDCDAIGAASRAVGWIFEMNLHYNMRRFSINLSPLHSMSVAWEMVITQRVSDSKRKQKQRSRWVSRRGPPNLERKRSGRQEETFIVKKVCNHGDKRFKKQIDS